MKKQNLKSLKLNKKTISGINNSFLKGGAANNNSGAAATTAQTASGTTFTYTACSTRKDFRTNAIFCG